MVEPLGKCCSKRRHGCSGPCAVQEGTCTEAPCSPEEHGNLYMMYRSTQFKQVSVDRRDASSSGLSSRAGGWLPALVRQGPQDKPDKLYNFCKLSNMANTSRQALYSPYVTSDRSPVSTTTTTRHMCPRLSRSMLWT